MEISQQEVKRLFSEVQFMQKKIVQVIRIKARLDQRREETINKLKNYPDESIIDELWILYRKELHLLQIIKKGIKNVNEFERGLDAILVDVGVLKHLWGVFKRKKTNLDLQSIIILRYASKKTKKCLRGMNSEFQRVTGHFFNQFQILKLIKQKSQEPDLINDFLREYDVEVKSIKKFYKTGINDLLIKLINKVSPKQAVILWGLSNIPASAQITPLSAFYFGIQYAIILGVISEIVKWSLVGGYSFYLYQRKG